MINKKTLLIVSGVFALSLVALDQIGTDILCGWIQQDTTCTGALYGVMMNLFPIIPLFILSLITYKMREEVYRAWLGFARVWIPLSMVLIFLSPEYAESFGVTLYSITKGSVAFFSSLLFIIISSVVIFLKSTATRRA